MIDVFLFTMRDLIGELNRSYRQFVQKDVEFYETTKALLLRILEVVELFGGEKWGTKYVGQHEARDCDERSVEFMIHRSEFNDSRQDEAHLDERFEAVRWQENERDNELPLLVEEYFYVWVKELGREEYETENCGDWSR